MTPDHSAFLAEIIARRDEEAPRLISPENDTSRPLPI